MGVVGGFGKWSSGRKRKRRTVTYRGRKRSYARIGWFRYNDVTLRMAPWSRRAVQ